VDLLAPGPLTGTERAGFGRAVVRGHVLARLPPPALIAWFGSVAAAQRYATAALAGDLAGAPVPSALVPASRASRARRRWTVPRAALLGLAGGGWLGAMASVIVIGLPFWLLGFGPPLIFLVGATLALRRARGIAAPVVALLQVGITIGFVVLLFGLLGWLGGFPKGTFLLPDPWLQWAFPACLALGAGAGAAIRTRSAWRRLRPAGARPDVVSVFENRLGGVLRGAAVTGSPGGSDALGRAHPGWRPIPPAGGPRGREPGPWGLLRAARARRRLAAVHAAARVLWRAYPGLVVAVEPPCEVHVGPAGLDRADGPAVVWPDGTEEYFLRGVRLPRSPVAGDWSVAEIHAVTNTEVRRVMIEAIGWAEYLRAADLHLVATAPDPGNDPHRLELYELPEDVFGPVRLLVMVNGSPDRDGSARCYAEFVPDDIDDAVQAAAWQYGVPVAVYRDLQRRT
jgi:hypothetical protein